MYDKKDDSKNYAMERIEKIATENVENLITTAEDVISIPSEDEKSEIKYSTKLGLITPIPSAKKRSKRDLSKKAATTIRKTKTLQEVNETAEDGTLLTVISTNAKTTAKKSSRSKEPPPSQLRIDTFFKSCTKSYKVEPSTAIKSEKACSETKTNKKSKSVKTIKKRSTGAKSVAIRKGRKRLFKADADDGSTTTVSSVSVFRDMTPLPKTKSARKRASTSTLPRVSAKCAKAKKTLEDLELLINLCSDDEVEENKKENSPRAEVVSPPRLREIGKIDGDIDLHEMPCTSAYSASKILQSSTVMVSIPAPQKCTEIIPPKSRYILDAISSTKNKSLTTFPVLKESQQIRNKSHVRIKEEPYISPPSPSAPASPVGSLKIATVQTCRIKIEKDLDLLAPAPPSPPQTSTNTSNSNNLSSSKVQSSNTTENASEVIDKDKPSTSTNNKGGRGKKIRVCPPYKIVAGTTFAVDAFNYGEIAGVTHYFLTHFHADHYVGLTRKFAMPLYVSPLTARLVRALIPIDEQYLHEIDLNTPVKIDGVEVTAIDANHCPGAVMFVFKLPNARCIIHTGDFRASPEMESEPIFWNNIIDTIYLDTTYIGHKHNFCSQHESIDRAKGIIEEFHTMRPDVRILYVCGSYVIGKERFWTSLAQEFNLKVWTEKNRLKALRAMDLDEVRELLCDDPYKAQMHVISIGKVSYQSLVEYFRPFQTHFDVVLAFRPSGWEKNSKPQLRGQINIVGIEYSEHSSHAELERFVTYLKPREVISTVPVMQGNPCITPKIPHKWYKYDSLRSRKRNFQPSITSFITMRPRQLGQANATTTTATKRTTTCLTPKKSPSCRRHDLSQLSVRAMATCVGLPSVDNDGVVDTDMPPAVTNKDVAATVITLFPDLDAYDDWIS